MSVVAEVSALVQRTELALWPEDGALAGSSVWAIVDTARDQGLYSLLVNSRLEFRCLYSGERPAELDRVAPQLVELLPGHRLTRALLSMHGRAWGVALRTRAPDGLRHHLRHFLVVRDPQARRLVFRYYDPRVLRVFLPTCLPAEVNHFFGPVDSWFAEGPGGRDLLEFRTDTRNGLSVRAWPVQVPSLSE